MPEAQIRALRTVKLVHTAAWAFFAGCVVLIPVAAWFDRYMAVLILTAFVLLETGILAFNGWKCPLTPIAARLGLAFAFARWSGLLR